MTGMMSQIPLILANAFNTFFTTVGNNLASEIPISNINPTSYIKPVGSAFLFSEITIDVVMKILKTINSKKATGLHGIPCRILKIAAETLSPSLTMLLMVVRKILSNYRPISIISAIAKVFGRLVCNQFYTYI